MLEEEIIVCSKNLINILESLQHVMNLGPVVTYVVKIKVTKLKSC